MILRRSADESGNLLPDYDLILLGAGSSAGAEDFSSKVVECLGTLLVHGVAVRPGHPVILGILKIDKRSIPVIGVPGYPVSSAMTGEIFVEPLLAKWLGRRANELPVEMAEMTRKTSSPGGDDDYIRVVVGKVGKKNTGCAVGTRSRDYHFIGPGRWPGGSTTRYPGCGGG